MNGESQVEYDRTQGLPENQLHYLDIMDKKMDEGIPHGAGHIFAPDEQQTAFSGELKVVNFDNTDDFAIIQCSLSTPKVKQSFIQQFLVRFPVLRNIFGL